jgi:hypothetical protein
LSGRNPRLVLPTRAALLEVCNGRELGRSLDAQIGKSEHHGFDASLRQVVGFKRGGGSQQPPVTAPCRLVRLRPVSQMQNRSKFGERPHLAAPFA